MRKGEIACYKQFLLFLQCFPQLYIFSASKCGIVWEWVKVLLPATHDFQDGEENGRSAMKIFDTHKLSSFLMDSVYFHVCITLIGILNNYVQSLALCLKLGFLQFRVFKMAKKMLAIQ